MPSKNSTTKGPLIPKELKGCKAFISLTDKQRKFVLEYLKDYNGKQAAIRTGYAENSAEVQASRLLINDKVADALREISEIIVSEDIADVKEIREFLTNVMRGNITDVCSFTQQGLLMTRHSDEMDAQTSRLIKKIKVTEKTSNTGDLTEIKTEMELHDPIRAAELLGKSHGMFKDQVEHSGNFTGKITVEFVK